MGRPMISPPRTGNGASAVQTPANRENQCEKLLADTQHMTCVIQIGNANEVVGYVP